MIPLPQRFRCEGFEFTILKRIGKIVLLTKSKPGMSDSFEVAIIQAHPAERIGDRAFPAREKLPKTSLWGQQGWSYGHDAREMAEAKVSELIKVSIPS